MHHTQLPDTILSDKVCSARPLAGSSSVAPVLEAQTSLVGSCDSFTLTSNCPVDLQFDGHAATNHYLSNQQFSITAVTTSTGSVAERYAYTAYGQPTFLDASGTPLTTQTSTLNARYLYTGREWDETLGVYHFRARWMSGVAGRFLGRDPIGYWDGMSLVYLYFGIEGVDPSGEHRGLLVRPPVRTPMRPPTYPVRIPRRDPGPRVPFPSGPGQSPTWNPGRGPVGPFPTPPSVMPGFPFDPPMPVPFDPPYPNGPEIGNPDRCQIPTKPRTKERPRTKACRKCFLELPGRRQKCNGLNGAAWLACMEEYQRSEESCRKACNTHPDYDEELFEECIKDA